MPKRDFIADPVPLDETHEQILQRLMDRDPREAWEASHGGTGSYVDRARGFLQSQAILGAMQDDLLEVSGDTSIRTTVAQFVRIAEGLGFAVVHTEPFEAVGPKYVPNPDPRSGTACVAAGDDPASARAETTTYLFDRARGALLVLQSYRTTGINRARLYCNWAPHPETPDARPGGANHHARTEDGRAAYVVGADVREAFVRFVRDLERRGRFVPEWVDAPAFWFVTYMDERRLEALKDLRWAEYDRLNAEYLGKLPDAVLHQMGFTRTPPTP